MNLKNGVSRKQSMSNFPKNEHFVPLDTHTYVCVSGGKKCSFFGKFVVFCFLETPVLRFAILPYYRRKMKFGKFWTKNWVTGKSQSDYDRFQCIRGGLVESIRFSKEKFHLHLSADLSNPSISAETYWSILKSLLMVKRFF